MSTANPGRVAGKIALVTGAARGLGEAIAQVLIEQGARVFVSDIDARGVCEASQRIGAEGHFDHDVTRPEQWHSHVSRVIELCGRLDILVNNAGIALSSDANDIMNVSPQDWNRVVEINGLGTLLGCQAALAAMGETGGSIVNLSSVVSMTPSPTIAAYGFSKAGVAHLSRSMAELGAPLKIRCNSVHPGMIRTDMIEGLEAYHSSGAGASSEKAREAFASAIPMGECQTGRDIAMGVLYLASDEARFVTGAQLVIDGGMSL